MGSVWSLFRVGLELVSGRSRIGLESVCDLFGIGLGSTLGRLKGRSVMDPSSIWIALESVPIVFGIKFVVIGRGGPNARL